MANTNLVGVSNTLDSGRQNYNLAVSTYYNIQVPDIPEINGLLKSEYSLVGKSRLLARINDKWITIAYEDPIPTDIMYYDDATGKMIMTKDLDALKADFSDITATNGRMRNLNATEVTASILTVDTLNVINKINQMQTEQLLVEDNIVKLNSNLSGSPDTFKHLVSGLIINRGNATEAELNWDESHNRWVVSTPDDSSNAAKVLELFGITDNNYRTIDVFDSAGIYYSADSAVRNPGSYIQHDDTITGIYYNNDSERYQVKDKENTLELIGINVNDANRKVRLDRSSGIEIYNPSGENTELSLIQKDPDGRIIGGAIRYNSEANEMQVVIKNGADESSYPIPNIQAFNPFGDSWYYTFTMVEGNDIIELPADKLVTDTSKDLLMVYINGLHISPEDYTVNIRESGNSIVLKEPLKEDSTVTIYHHLFMSQNYRLPQKVTPNIITGVTGKEFYVTHSSDSLVGAFQCLVLKNGRILVVERDYTCERITTTRAKITLTEDLVTSDELIVYPFLTPNIFVQGDDSIVFKLNETSGTANILFERRNLPAAGLRWNENSNNLEVNTGNDIWEAITGSSAKFGKKKYVIEEDTDTLNISDLLTAYSLVPDENLSLSVFRNGILQDDESDYALLNYDLKFNHMLLHGENIMVYAGKAFIKSHNDLVNKKYVAVIEEPTEFLDFGHSFRYEPGAESLSIFVNGILTQRNIDYIELDEHSVLFNYYLDKDTVIQAYSPTICTGLQYNKRIFEFHNVGDGDYLNSNTSDCSIIVNRGNASIPPAVIKWDEARDGWYLSNGDGVFKKILTSSRDSAKFAQIYEYTDHGGVILDVSNMVGHPKNIMVFLNGQLLRPKNGIFAVTGDYFYDIDGQQISFTDSFTISDHIVILAYDIDESTASKVYEFTDRIGSVLDVSSFAGNPDKIMVFRNGKLLLAKEQPSTGVGDYYYDRLNKTITFSLDLSASEAIIILAYTSSEAEVIRKYKNFYLDRYAETITSSRHCTIGLKGSVPESPEVLVYFDGNLMNTSDYALYWDPDFNALDIGFNEDLSGELDVIIISNNQQIASTGVENTFTFDVAQEDYRDGSASGSWYIKSDRGRRLSSVYIKWDEVANKFKFNDGNHREYDFPKVVFGEELFTPEYAYEEIYFIQKSTMKTFAHYDGVWHDLDTKQVVS